MTQLALEEQSSEVEEADPRRWGVLASFALISCSNGLMWLDFGGNAVVAEAVLGVDELQINRLYSFGLKCAAPSMLLSVLLVDRFDWCINFLGALVTVGCALIRVFALRWRSYDLAWYSSALLGFGMGPVLVGFSRLPAQWFPRGHERFLASAIAVQSNFLGWGLGALVVPMTCVSEAKMIAFQLPQAFVVSLCIPFFCIFYQGTSENKKRRSRTKSITPTSALADRSERRVVCQKLCQRSFMLQASAIVLLQCIGFTIPGIQEEILVSEGIKEEDCAAFGFLFIFAGVVLGLVLGELVPASPRGAHRVLVGLFALCFVSTLGLQALLWDTAWIRGTTWGSPQYLAYLVLLTLVGGCSLGYLNVALPLVCEQVHPVSESLSGGLIEFSVQILAAYLVEWSTGRGFKVCCVAAGLALLLLLLGGAPADDDEDSSESCETTESMSALE